MSIKKVALSFALAGILGATSMVAETDGAFVGVQAGYGGLKLKVESEYDDGAGNVEKGPSESISANGFRYGFVLGYKSFFTPEFGARYYAAVDLGTDYKKDLSDTDPDTGETTKTTIKVNTYNITANADALYNFVSSRDLDFGAFLGLSLGYANHKYKGEGESPDIKPSGFDLGINFGLRTNIAQNHGIELYSRFGVLQQKKEIKESYENGDFDTQTYKAQQPYQVGLRYIFSF